MTKATKKTPKEASDLFHKIMAASVKENPKPKPKNRRKERQKMNIKFYSLYLVAIILLFFQTGCTEKRTDDPIKAFLYWSGEPPTKEIKLLHGKYWQSANFSKEYEMWLEFEAPSTWIHAYIQQNKLIKCADCDSVRLPAESPTWFNPGKKCEQLLRAEDNFGSMYFYDTSKSKMFIYETQL